MKEVEDLVSLCDGGEQWIVASQALRRHWSNGLSANPFAAHESDGIPDQNNGFLAAYEQATKTGQSVSSSSY